MCLVIGQAQISLDKIFFEYIRSQSKQRSKILYRHPQEFEKQNISDPAE